MIYVVCNVETGDLLQIGTEAINVSGHPLMDKANLPQEYRDA